MRIRTPYGVNAAIVVLSLLAVFIVAGASTPTEAAQSHDFDPSYIISDSNFYDRSAMSQVQIQDFLNQKIGICSNEQCLNVGSFSTMSRDRRVSDTTGNVRCEAYRPPAIAGAAAIIYAAQQSCSISAKVLLVTLQKEQLLVSGPKSRAPSIAALDRAMGYACPDTGTCTVLGFDNQVYSAALQLSTYKNSRFGKQPGTQNILFHPDASRCGSALVNVRNYATAALYNYTPYQPDAAALANLYGTGGSCSSYGNRNFWAYFTDWFGSPTGPVDPFGTVDEVSATTGVVSARGWGIDPDSSDPIIVHVYRDGAFATGVRADRPRADISAHYPDSGADHGFEASFSAAPGEHEICVYGINIGPGENALLECERVVVPAPVQPFGYVDSVVVSGLSVSSSGWALDPSVSSSVYVHVYVDGRFLTGFPADRERQDVAAAFRSSGPLHGFSQSFDLPPGTHMVCFYGLNAALTASAQLSCIALTTQPAQPVGYLDSITNEVDGLRLTGWAFDPTVDGLVYVHVYSGGVFVGGFPTSIDRSDVGAVYPGHGSLTGFDFLVSSVKVGQPVCVHALNYNLDGSRLLGCR